MISRSALRLSASISWPGYAKRSLSACLHLQRRQTCVQVITEKRIRWHYKCSLNNFPKYQTPEISVFVNYSTRRRGKADFAKNKSDPQSSRKDDSEEIDDLKAIWKDSSLSLTAKFKVLFRQYSLVLIVVHLMTAVFWMTIFYLAVSWGLDIVPLLEKYGFFDFLEKIGLPASEKLKSPGASNLISAYLIYEIAKPIRYPVTILGTIYAVRLLRRFKYIKPPPKADTTVRELVQSRRKIVRKQFSNTTSRYRERFMKGQFRRKLSRKNGVKNGKHN